MDILIGCEYSGIVRDAFIRAGHNAVSCDLLPTETPGPHIIGDIRKAIKSRTWDMGIFFPPCTYLAKCQIAQMLNDKGRMKAAARAVKLVQDIYYSDIEKVAIENPVGVLSTVWQKPHQIIQPWWWGNPHSKEISLWLKDLPPLISGPKHWRRQPVANHVNSRMTQEQKSHIKSKFFPEVAQAMADQWG